MTISLLQLNTESARFLDTIIPYIKQHDFDILHLQEISGGSFNRYQPIDAFEVIKQRLGYKGVLTMTTNHFNDVSSYFGKAILFKPTFQLVSQKEIWLKPYRQLKEFPKTPEEIEQLPHNAIHLTLQKDRTRINCINTHLAWGPTPEDKPYKLAQAKILVDYMKTMNQPFIFSGDFNVTSDSQIVHWFDALATNLTTKNNVTNTLNPHTHRVQSLFPKGLAVDYIYTSNDIRVNNFELITEDLSDHLGLKVEVDI